LHLDYFEYPLNTKKLLRKKLAIKKELLSQNTSFIEKRIAVLGGSTTKEIVDQLDLFLLSYGIKCEFYQSEYGKYWEDVMFGNPMLIDFHPDIIFIHTTWRNIHVFPEMKDSNGAVDSLVNSSFGDFEQMWNRIRKVFACPIIQNNFDRPSYRLLGNRDIWDYRGRSNFIFRLNSRFYEYAQKNEGFYINDIDYISQKFGFSQWNDSSAWNLYKYALSFDAIPLLAQSVAHIIKSIYGKNKKVVVLDLDNTLWGGVIGDDGVDEIEIGPEVPIGQIYSEFQYYLKSLKNIGAILTIDSKNDLKNAMSGLGHPDSVLSADDFVSIKANWVSKDQNILDISRELSLDPDSFVFVDDNPVERDIVRKQIPGVAVPEMDRVENYIKILDHNGYFETTSISDEDFNKTKLYQSKAMIEETKGRYSNYEDFLDSLEMRALIGDFKPVNIKRIAQLTNKSNQFNLTTLRCTENDIKKMQDSSSYICLSGKLVDKFSDNGIVSVVVGKINENNLEIILWIMSCRVLNRGLEFSMMNCLMDKASQLEISNVKGYYYPSSKNLMVKDFYKDMGFTKKSEDENGSSVWELNVREFNSFKVHMQIAEI